MTLARRSRSVGAALVGALLVLGGAGVSVVAQIPGRNVNMVAGTTLPDGDPYLQRQNEPSMAASTRNPLHLVAGSNDYRTVDLPGLPDGEETGDAWVSVYKSFDGGERWSSTLMPGYPQEPLDSPGRNSPLFGYQAAADPVVRAGTSGLVYYNGLVFDRGENGKSGIFLARFIDRNDREAEDPINYLGASMVATSPDGAVFLDKPWMVVDLPRGNANLCVVGGEPTGARVRRSGHRRRGRGNGPPIWVDPSLEYVEAGAVYVGYTAITGEGPTLQSQIFVKRSLDCGATWSQAMRVSQPADRINQGLTLAVSPLTGDLFAAWRRFSAPDQPDADAIMVSRLRINGGSFDAPGRARGLRRTGPVADALERIFEHRKKRSQTTTTTAVDQIDQSTGPFRFRTNAYPALAVDGGGRAYVAWSERGFASINNNVNIGEARIVIATTTDGRTVSEPVAVDEQAQSGHQLMPSLTFAGGKLMLVFYDQRETSSQLVGTFVDDATLVTKRNTIDIRAALGTPGATPLFAPSVRVSDYAMGFTNSSSPLPRQLQFNPPNLPMFKLGTVPFIGDYIDVAPSPAFVPTASGEWVYNTASTGQIPTFHAVWTDNRDVRPPLNGDWTQYAPPNTGACLNAGSRNQNIYTARIGGGLLVGAPGNAKPLSPTVQRGFVVYAQNQTTLTKRFRMTVLAQPPGGRASFEQFPLPPYTASSPAPTTVIDVKVPPRSTASRTVYATSTDPKAQIPVDVVEVAVETGGAVADPLAGRVVLNPDIENPDIENPDIENTGVPNPDIENAEVYNPDIENPDIENPDIENQFVKNPDIENPDIENIVVANPDIENVGVGNPDIENPDIENPDIENPDIENPDIENGAVADVTWTVTNIGNTTSAFNINLLLAGVATDPANQDVKTQLVVYKVYKTPVLDPNGCNLRTESRNVILYNLPSPTFVAPGQGLPDQNNSEVSNATLWLNPGEVGRVTLRLFDEDTSDSVIVGRKADGTPILIDPAFNPNTVLAAAVSGQGVDVLDPPGATEPPAVTTTGTNLFFLQQPTNTAPGATLGATVGELFAPVRVRVWDNTGAPLPDVPVTIVLCGPQDPELPAVACPAPPEGVVLSGTTTVNATSLGIASFGDLRVNLPATGLRLRAFVPTATEGVLLAAGTSAPFDVTSTGGPVSLWRADGNALDSVGTNHGTLQGGAGYAMGRIGPGFNVYAGTLAEPTQLVAVPDSPSLRITNQLTMSAWIYPAPDAGPNRFGRIIDRQWAYSLMRANENNLGYIRWSFGNGVNSSYGSVSLTNAVAPPNTWTHVAVTYNNGVVATYINGGLVDSRTTGVLGAGPGITTIGGPAAPLLEGPRGFFDGGIDQVELYNRALTAFEVAAMYNAALPQVAATVSISNVNAIFDGADKPVTVTTTPSVPALTLYNSSTTVPSAIGAYYVQAIVNQNGFAGAAGVTHKIASTSPVGGNGGGPIVRSCGPGVFATGFGVNNDNSYGMLNAQLECETGGPTQRFVLDNDSPRNLFSTCGPNQVMVGFNGYEGLSDGTAGPFVKALGARCQDRSGVGGVISIPVVGSTDQTPVGPFDCPAGQAVTGVVGGAGSVLDSVALVCAAIPTTPTSVYVLGTAGGTVNTNCSFCGSGPGGTAPVDSGFLLNPGDTVTVTASGLVNMGSDGPFGPSGNPSYSTYWRQFVLDPTQTAFSLIARIGSGPWQFVGAGPTALTAPIGGTGGSLQFAVNDSLYSDNSGGWTVTIQRQP